MCSRQTQKAGGDGQDCAHEDADTSRNEPVADGAAAKGGTCAPRTFPLCVRVSQRQKRARSARSTGTASPPAGESAGSIGIRMASILPGKPGAEDGEGGGFVKIRHFRSKTDIFGHFPRKMAFPQWLEMSLQRLEMNPFPLEMNLQRLEMNPFSLEMNLQWLEMNNLRLEMNIPRLEKHLQWLEIHPLRQEKHLQRRKCAVLRPGIHLQRRKVHPLRLEEAGTGDGFGGKFRKQAVTGKVTRTMPQTPAAMSQPRTVRWRKVTPVARRRIAPAPTVQATMPMPVSAAAG